jgi:hypothetical protein
MCMGWVLVVGDVEMILHSLQGALSSQGQKFASFSKQQHEVRDLKAWVLSRI